MCRILFPILAITLYAHSVVSQSSIEVDTASANRYYFVADSLIDNSYFKEAIEYCEKAKTIYSEYNLYEELYTAEESIIECLWRNGDFQLALNRATLLLKNIRTNFNQNHILEGRLFFELGTIYFLNNQPKLAIENFNESIEIYSKNDSSQVQRLISNASLNLGAVYYRLGNYDLALKLFLKSMKIDKTIYGNNHLYIVDHYNNIGLIYSSLNNYDSAMVYYQQGLSILKETENERLLAYSNILEGIGILKISYGEYDNAKDYIFQSLNHRINIYGITHPELNYNYNNLGLIFFEKKRYDSSLYYYKKALIEYNKYKENPSADLTSIYDGLVMNYFMKKNYKKALELQKKSILILENTGHMGIKLPRAFYYLGLIYSEKKDEKIATKYYEKSIDLYIALFGSSQPYLAEPYIALSKIERDNKDYKEALWFLQSSLSYNVDSFEFNSIYDLPPEKGYYNQLFYLESLILKANILVLKFESENNDRDLLAAIETFKLCDTLFDNIRFSYQSYKDKIQFQSQFFLVYLGAIDAMFQAYKIFDNDTYLRECFYFFEKSKARNLTDILSDSRAKKKGNIPDNLLLLESTIKKSISFYQKELFYERYENKNRDSLKLGFYEKKVFDINNKYDSLIKKLEGNNPKYYNIKYATKTASINDIQTQLLKENQALIEYFIGDSSIYIFAITKSNFEVKKVEKDSVFSQQLKSFINVLHQPNLVNHSKKDYEEYVSTAHNLYNYLIAPVDSLITGKELIIIPDGELALIPFEALLTHEASSTEVNYQSLPYLIKEHAISYANSATLLFNEMQNSKTLETQNNGNILAFAPHFGNNLLAYNTKDTVRSKLSPLNWTVEEVNNLSSYFNTKVYTNAKATEKSFKQEAGNYSILHIASHGLVDDENPMYSKIAFAIDEADTLNDGYLHTFELYNTELNADMAVLSACNTGYGKVLKGEGVLNLARGFFYAGCKSVVMSLWVANDKSTATLMGGFYKHLAAGQPKNSALQHAKLDYIKNNEGFKAHPYYWSQFIISGNTDPISRNIQSKWIIFLLIGLPIFLLLTIYLVNKNKLVKTDF